ncbi:DUF6397 family protein [Streptomyces sp. NPDC054796]
MRAMPENVAMRTAAKEWGLRPGEMELAVQLDVVRTVPGAAGGPRRVPREEVDRLAASEGALRALRERLRVVGAAEGAALLKVSPARFTRLARCGCFGPVRFYVNRYRAVVWLYLAEELRGFGERRPGLLTGRTPGELRALLDRGADHRPVLWRARRVEQLVRQAPGPWERAAARASVLDEDALAEAVPDATERACLAALRPALVTVRHEGVATQEAVDELCRALEEDEVAGHRLMLGAELEEARASEPCPLPRSGPGAHSLARLSPHAGAGAPPADGSSPAPGPGAEPGPDPGSGSVSYAGSGLAPGSGSGQGPVRDPVLAMTSRPPRQREEATAPDRRGVTGAEQQEPRGGGTARAEGRQGWRGWLRKGSPVSRPAF